MSFTKGLGHLGRIGLDERRIAVRQIHAEIVEPHQLAVDDPVRLAEIYLCVPRLVAQGYEHLAAAQRPPPHNRGQW
jgi:hypothetical protein